MYVLLCLVAEREAVKAEGRSPTATGRCKDVSRFGHLCVFSVIHVVGSVEHVAASCSYKLLYTLVATDLILYRLIATVMQSCSKLFRGDVAKVFHTACGTLLERETTTKQQ